MVRPLILAFAVLLAAAPASAALAPAADASGLITPAVLAALKQIKAAAPQWTSVNMLVSSGPGFVMITEPRLGVHVNGSRTGGGLAWFSGVVGNGGALSFDASAFGGGWSLFGSGVNVTMSPFGDGFSVWGSVDGKNLNYTISRFGSGLTVWGQSGFNGNVSGWASNLQVYGQIDGARFDGKALAVMGATLALAAPAAQKERARHAPGRASVPRLP